MLTDDAITVLHNVTYATADGTPLALDTYERPAGIGTDSRRPGIVLIHGGGWFRGDKSKELALATRLVDAGYVVFVPNYRLTPEHIFPTGRDDVLAAAAWARASDYAFDRSRMAFFGGSAGGNLAIEAAVSTGCPAVSWSGIFDLEAIVLATEGSVAATPTTQDLDAMRSADINQTGRDDAFLRWVILEEVGQQRELLVAASTTRHVTATTGQVYLANSLAEFVPVSDPVALQHALAEVGVASVLQLIPGTRHAEGYLEQAIEGSLAFLRRALTADQTVAPRAVQA